MLFRSIFLQFYLIAFSDAVVIWCIYAKILLDMALASSDANALTQILIHFFTHMYIKNTKITLLKLFYQPVLNFIRFNNKIGLEKKKK